jgi:integrase
MKHEALVRSAFTEAASAWLESRRAYISPKTFHEYELNVKTLSAFFGEMKLIEITPDQIRAYQKMRLTQCGPCGINHECSVLQQMLKRIGRWQDIAFDYQALPLPKEERGRALRDEEKKLLLDIASANPEWEAAYCFALISVNTSAGPKETYTLRLKDVDLDARVITIQPQGAKNVHRIRTIPLNTEALMGARLAVARAKRIGSVEPEHYLFPFRLKRNSHDPKHHQTTFKTAWKKLTTKAGLQGLRMYDLRHHAITVLLENPKVSEETAEHIAGHISRRMKKRYSHARLDSMRQAVEALTPIIRKKSPQKSAKSTDQTEVAQKLVDLLSKLLKTS